MRPVVLMALGACHGDVGDSCDTAGCADGPPRLQRYDYACDEASCTWTVDADGQVEGVELRILETADPTFEPGCSESDIGWGGEVCSAWAEYHFGFGLVEGDAAYELRLALAASEGEQAINVSTLFDMGSPSTEIGVTWEIVLLDADGGRADCVKNGHDPGFFACENQF